jgi:hypothetical protein
MSLADAAIKSGYTANYASQAGNQALEQIRQKMPEVLDRHGFTDDSLVKKYLSPLLRANETKFFAHKGIVKETQDVAANDIRLRALDLTFKLKGSYAPIETKSEVEHKLTVAEMERAGNVLQHLRVIDVESKEVED